MSGKKSGEDESRTSSGHQQRRADGEWEWQETQTFTYEQVIVGDSSPPQAPPALPAPAARAPFAHIKLSGPAEMISITDPDPDPERPPQEAPSPSREKKKKKKKKNAQTRVSLPPPPFALPTSAPAAPVTLSPAPVAIALTPTSGRESDHSPHADHAWFLEAIEEEQEEEAMVISAPAPAPGPLAPSPPASAPNPEEEEGSPMDTREPSPTRPAVSPPKRKRKSRRASGVTLLAPFQQLGYHTDGLPTPTPVTISPAPTSVIVSPGAGASHTPLATPAPADGTRAPSSGVVMSEAPSRAVTCSPWALTGLGSRERPHVPDIAGDLQSTLALLHYPEPTTPRHRLSSGRHVDELPVLAPSLLHSEVAEANPSPPVGPLPLSPGPPSGESHSSTSSDDSMDLTIAESHESTPAWEGDSVSAPGDSGEETDPTLCGLGKRPWVDEDDWVGEDENSAGPPGESTLESVHASESPPSPTLQDTAQWLTTLATPAPASAPVSHRRKSHPPQRVPIKRQRVASPSPSSSEEEDDDDDEEGDEERPESSFSSSSSSSERENLLTRRPSTVVTPTPITLSPSSSYSTEDDDHDNDDHDNDDHDDDDDDDDDHDHAESLPTTEDEDDDDDVDDDDENIRLQASSPDIVCLDSDDEDDEKEEEEEEEDKAFTPRGPTAAAVGACSSPASSSSQGAPVDPMIAAPAPSSSSPPPLTEAYQARAKFLQDRAQAQQEEAQFIQESYQWLHRECQTHLGEEEARTFAAHMSALNAACAERVPLFPGPFLQAHLRVLVYTVTRLLRLRLAATGGAKRAQVQALYADQDRVYVLHQVYVQATQALSRDSWTRQAWDRLDATRLALARYRQQRAGGYSNAHLVHSACTLPSTRTTWI